MVTGSGLVVLLVVVVRIFTRIVVSGVLSDTDSAVVVVIVFRPCFFSDAFGGGSLLHEQAVPIHCEPV